MAELKAEMDAQATSAPTAVGMGYDPFAFAEGEIVAKVHDWMQADPNSKLKTPHPNSTFVWFTSLLTPKSWLSDTHIDAGINLLRKRYSEHEDWFRSNRLAFLDSLFPTLWREGYQLFAAHVDHHNGTALFPSGSYDIVLGEYPQYFQSKRVWGVDVDEIYSPLHVKGCHWVAMWISIPNRHVTVWDSSLKLTTNAEVQEAVRPICEILPYILYSLAPNDEKHNWPTAEFTYERIHEGVPQNPQSGDCGVYCLKFIELHALGLIFDSSKLCDANISQIREKLAADIFEETTFRGIEKEDYMDRYWLL